MKSLLELARSILEKSFKGFNHQPNSDQLKALDDVLLHLCMMAEGKLEKKYYISSLDPGVGKTQAVISFLKALTSSQYHGGVGVIVGVSKKNEITAIINGLNSLKISKNQYAVLVSDYLNSNLELRSIGSSTPEKAQILLTTHQMISHRCLGVGFESVSAFQFNGSPRAIRIWDESLLPAEQASLSSDDIAGTLNDLFQQGYLKERAKLEALQIHLVKATDGDDINLFSFLGQLDESGIHAIVGLQVILNYRNQLSPKTRETLQSLISMSNTNLVVRQNQGVANLVGFSDVLPIDLTPLLILDASARLRHTYQLWKDERGNLVPLKTAVKDYSKLTIHHWNKGGGKSAMKTNHYRYAVAISDAINLSPDESWLVIHHKKKDDDSFDMEQLIETTLGSTPSGPKPNVRYLSWGNHTATNEYKDASHIILVGTLFYRPIDYEAIAYAAMGKTLHGKVNVELRDKTQMGESLHGIFQAACRGTVRNITDGQADTCDVYLIADARNGFTEELQRVFPGCQSVEWIPEPPEPTGKVLDLINCLVSFFDQQPDAIYVFRAIKNKLSMNSSQQLTTLRKHPVLLIRLQELGIEEHSPNVRATGYRKPPQKPELATAL